MPDLTEPKALVTLLHEELRLPMLDFTIGNPYVNPHVNRPYDGGPYVPDEHPLEGVARMLGCIGQLKKAFPSLCVIGSGFSYLRQFSPYLAAGAVEQSVCDLAGFGAWRSPTPIFRATRCMARASTRAKPASPAGSALPYARRHSRGVRGARWGNLSAVLSGALLCINKKFIWKR